MGPHLFVDTCSILDIMRDATRKDARANDRQAALDVLAAGKSGRVTVWVAHQVTLEFAENVELVETESEGGIKRFRDAAMEAHAIVSLFGGLGKLKLDHFDGHTARARSVADERIALSHLIPDPPGVGDKAFNRVRNNIAPASKGTQSVKDCVVLETYLDKARDLRAAGEAGPMVYLSSNRADYCVPQSIILRPPLDAEFSALSIVYWPDFRAAKRALGF